MEKFKIKIGDFDLIESGSVITMKDADIRFSIKDLEYVFQFTTVENEETKINIVSNDGKKMIINLQNFNSSLGGGNVNPMPMGILEEVEIYFLFRVSQLSEGGKTMHYSWLSRPIIFKEENHE